MAAGFKNERPSTEPMFSPAGASYYRTWRAAIRCWVRDPAKRPSMDEVARLLQPLEPPRPEPSIAPSTVFQPDDAPVTLSARTDIRPDDEVGGDDEGDEETIYCYCERETAGTMIDCSDERCDREWVSLASKVLVATYTLAYL